jgi:hypothetical protein
MPGPISKPEGGKTKFNRNKPRRTMRGADGVHKQGSQNRNKSGRGNKP